MIAFGSQDSSVSIGIKLRAGDRVSIPDRGSDTVSPSLSPRPDRLWDTSNPVSNL